MNHTKYPRTFHLPGSPGVTSDDKVLRDLSSFEGQNVVVTMKMDGENTTLHRTGVHARSLDSRGGLDRDWVKGFWSGVAHDIPEGWCVCGENLWAKHSIHYTDLPSYFLAFSVWNGDTCLSWNETEIYFYLLGIEPVPVLYRGPFSEKMLKEVEAGLDLEKNEGFVVRLAGTFQLEDFGTSVAKWVRTGHVVTDQHWRHSKLVPNQLK